MSPWVIFIWALPPKGGRALRLKQIPLKGDTRLQSLTHICSVLFLNHPVLYPYRSRKDTKHIGNEKSNNAKIKDFTII